MQVNAPMRTTFPMIVSKLSIAQIRIIFRGSTANCSYYLEKRNKANLCLILFPRSSFY
jgi:hypothetical protein